jgi:excisionase family DNA binding protein
MADEYYTVQELAAKFKVTQQSIHNWIKAGKIASIKLGRVRRIPAAEVERLIREGIPEYNGDREKIPPGLASA